MPTTLLYVRHAEVFNPENLLYGRLPRFRLSDYGRYFAERAATYLQHEPIATFYTSPQLRARQTVRILARKHPGVPAKVRADLAEVRTSWQGTAYHALPSDKTVYESRRQPGDESIDDVWQRMHRLAEELRQAHAGQTVLCVSHGDPIKILTLGYQGLALDEKAVRQPEPARCSVTRFTFHQPDAPPEVAYTDILAAPTFKRVGTLADFPPGSLTRIELDRRVLLIVRTSEGSLHALSNRCPHMRAHLHEGTLEGTTLTCPLHGSQFRVTNGELLRGPQCGIQWSANFGVPGRPLSPIGAGPVPTYEVRLEGEDVLLRGR